jgi:ATP-binding cassette, subfamily B, bacterial
VSFTPRDKPERTADKDQRRHNLRRVGGLFRAHRKRLGAVLGLIFLSAGLGMISPFLLRAVLDTAIP